MKVKSYPFLSALVLVELTFLVAATGRVQCPCSADFLLTLSMEFFKTRAYSIVTVVTDTNEKQQITRLKFLIHELQRLIQYPRLFRSASIETRFFALLGAHSRMQFGKACIDLLLEAEMHKIVCSSRKNETRKSYVDGSRSWENFLLDGAPGTPYRVVRTVPKSVFQVVPAGGMRIVADYEREESEIVRFVEQVSLHDVSCLSLLAGADGRSLKYRWTSKQ